MSSKRHKVEGSGWVSIFINGEHIYQDGKKVTCINLEGGLYEVGDTPRDITLHLRKKNTRVARSWD